MFIFLKTIVFFNAKKIYICILVFNYFVTMHKIILSIIIGGLFLNLNGQKITPLDSSIWKSNFDEAKKQANKNNLPIIMVFSGSDWCKPCIKLREQILVSPTFSEWAKKNAVCVTVDFPIQKKNQLPEAQKKHNDALDEQYNKNGVFPLVIILSQDGKVLDHLGYEDVTPEKYIEILEKIIKK